MKTTILFLLLAATPAYGETLLIQYQDRGGMFDGPLEASLTAGYPFTTTFAHSFKPTPLPPPYTTVVPVADGTTFAADVDTVDRVGDCLATSDCSIRFRTGNLYGAEIALTANQFWTFADTATRQIETFVDGFAGYRLTNITQTITGVTYWIETNSPYPYGGYFFGHTHGTIAQTVRIYGEAIPEPAALWLALFFALFAGFLFVSTLRKRN